MLLSWTGVPHPPVSRASLQTRGTQPHKLAGLRGDQTSAVSSSPSRREALQDLTGIAFLLSFAFPSQAKQTGYKQAQQPEQSKLSISDQIKTVRRLTSLAEEAAHDGKFDQALSCYDEIVHRFPDLAITEYARIHRAIFLYQTGNASRAILELEDEEVNLRGFAEVHAALACILHAERPREVGRAESQWEIASEFDTRFGNIEWVQSEKHWPPRLLAALQSFLSLA